MNRQSKLKIGIVFDDTLDNPDGVQQYILSVGKWLISQGHDVHYLVGKTTRNDVGTVHSLARNVAVQFNGNKLSIPLPTNRKQLAKMLADEQFDVLHIQMPYSPWLAHRLILAAPSETRIIGTFHIVSISSFVTLATKALAYWTRRSLQRFDAVVSVSSAAQAYAKQTYGIESKIVPNVFDFARFAAAKPKKSSRQRLNILFLGRLVERKGCRYLLEAILLLKQRSIDGFEVTICGKGELLPGLQRFASEHDLPVKFVGFVTEADKPSYYASADIAVFPSTGGESFGIVLVEAMANGRTAVIAAGNSGYTSVLESRSELLFPVKDAVALADALERLLADSAYRKDIAVWGKTHAAHFDVNLVGQSLIKLYAD